MSVFWMLHVPWLLFDPLMASQGRSLKRITSIKSVLFCMTTFSASLTDRTFFLLQSHDCSCYVSRPVLAAPPRWRQIHTDLCAHDFAHSADLWHQPRLANFTCAWKWGLNGINPPICYLSCLFCSSGVSFAYHSVKAVPLRGMNAYGEMEVSDQLFAPADLHQVRIE